jgi:catechol 2,3-dioxygenase-like lactoylglutathione lyase family enzyme
MWRREQFGQIRRREALIAFAAAGLSGFSRAAAAPDPAFRFSALDHVEISVPDSAKSAAFYSAIFGGPIWKNNQTERRYVMLGPCYVAIEQGRQPMGVDHFSVGIDDFDIDALHAYLKQQGITYRDYPSGRDLNVTDANGIHVQLSADNTWSQLKGATASPVPGTDAGEAIFRPLRLDHILLNVPDPEGSAAFYEKILGPVTQRNNGRIWLQTGRSRVGLLKTPADQKAGVNHFCVSAAPFDYAVVTKKLAGANAKLETPELAGAPEFRDPGGLLIQVIAAK